MPRPRPLLLAGLLVTAAEAAFGTVAIVAFGPIEIALYPLACAVGTGVVTALGIPLLRPRGGGGDGGSGTKGPEPPWWPDFEAHFRRHVRERERTSV